MIPKERVISAIEGGELEAPPVLPLIGAHSAVLANRDPREAFKDGRLMAELQMRAVEFYQPDGIFHYMDLTLEAEALGAEIEFKGYFPVVVRHCIPEEVELDVGKGRIPQEILQKPGKLTPAEWKEIKKHPLYSRQALEEANLTDERVLRIVEQHHETSDGQGYPYGLRAGEIDPGARLVQICDIFEALCGIRPYRRPLTPYEALRLMKEEMREKIDWELYRSFVRFLGPDYYRKVLRR